MANSDRRRRAPTAGSPGSRAACGRGARPRTRRAGAPRCGARARRGRSGRPRRAPARRRRRIRGARVWSPRQLPSTAIVRWRARPPRSYSGARSLAGHERAAADRGGGQRHPREAHGPGELQAPPAAAAAARALHVVVLEHGLARRGDLDEPEAAAVGDEALDRGPAVVGVAVGQLERARARQVERGDGVAVAIGRDHLRRPLGSDCGAARERGEHGCDGRHGPSHPPASS